MSRCSYFYAEFSLFAAIPRHLEFFSEQDFAANRSVPHYMSLFNLIITGRQGKHQYMWLLRYRCNSIIHTGVTVYCG